MKIVSIEKVNSIIEITFGKNGHHFTKEFKDRPEVKDFVRDTLTDNVKMALCLRMALTANIEESRASRVIGKTLRFDDATNSVRLV